MVDRSLCFLVRLVLETTHTSVCFTNCLFFFIVLVSNECKINCVFLFFFPYSSIQSPFNMHIYTNKHICFWTFLIIYLLWVLKFIDLLNKIKSPLIATGLTSHPAAYIVIDRNNPQYL